ncbi:hypothetical protein LCGC14_0514790 [marine sediment metagenome]|uniref:Uncharacterized protein n=1 Tax=marine sediment metagenome TaxID=412755 RepID=A0A0F9S0B2_9ZZZZ
MLKLTNGQIYQAKEPLQSLMEIKLPVRASYNVAKLAIKLNDKLRAIEETKNGLIKKYGKPGKDKPGQIEVHPDSEGFMPFVTEMNELMLVEEEVVFTKIQLPESVTSTCDKCSHNMDRPLEIEPSILMALEKFIEV